MSLVGYARVSTAEGRPSLTACLDYLRRGDVLVVLDLDRLGRRAGELITLIDELDQRGIGFRAINSPMGTTRPAGRAFLQIQAAFAEMERNVIRQRVREGVKAARARGRKGGRPRIMTPEKLRYAQSLMAVRGARARGYAGRGAGIGVVEGLLRGSAAVWFRARSIYRRRVTARRASQPCAGHAWC